MACRWRWGLVVPSRSLLSLTYPKALIPHTL